ncbi:MAG: hypothetical protein JO317_00645, partial [Verrucomicrobiae bacterium]|nr:hypothetical protein [Verrucomicrobiae bacterium]
MNTARAFAILVSSLLPVVPTLAQETTSFPKVTVRGSELYAGDEKLRLLSVGYDHCRPGQDPESPMAYQGYGYDLVDSDMAKIKAAGFNSIRTWHLI